MYLRSGMKTKAIEVNFQSSDIKKNQFTFCLGRELMEKTTFVTKHKQKKIIELENEVTELYITKKDIP